MSFFNSILDYLGFVRFDSYRRMAKEMHEQYVLLDDLYQEELRKSLEVRFELDRAKQRVELLTIAEKTANERLSAWQGRATRAEHLCDEKSAQLKDMQELHNKAMEDASLTWAQLEAKRVAICKHGEAQLEMDDLRAEVESELAFAQSRIRSLITDNRRLENSISSLHVTLSAVTSQRDMAKDAAAEALQYKPLYSSALEDIRKLKQAR